MATSSQRKCTFNPLVMFVHKDVVFYYKEAQEFFSKERVAAWVSRGITCIDGIFREEQHQEHPVGLPAEPGCYVYCIQKNPWTHPVSCDFLTPAGSRYVCHDYKKSNTKNDGIFLWSQDKKIDGIHRRITFEGAICDQPMGPVILQYIVPEDKAVDEETEEQKDWEMEDIQEAALELEANEIELEQKGGPLSGPDEGLEEVPELMDKFKNREEQLEKEKTPAEKENEKTKTAQKPSSGRQTSKRIQPVAKISFKKTSTARLKSTPTPSSMPGTAKKVWGCLKCRNHKTEVPVGSHKNCPYLSCCCPPCLRADHKRKEKERWQIKIKNLQASAKK